MKTIPLVAAFTAIVAAAARPVSAQDLRPTVSRLASAWARGDFTEIGTRAARSGLSIAVNGDKTGPYNERQAAAALKRVFEDRETLSARPGKSGVIPGNRRKAYVEISWTTRTKGSRIEEQTTVVLQLIEDGQDWRITEIHLRK